MAYPIVESVSTGYTAAYNSSGITITKPTGTVEGDLLIAVFAGDGGPIPAGLMSSSGWIEYANNYFIYGAMAVYAKVATDSEPANYNFSRPSSMYGSHFGMIRISGGTILGITPATSTFNSHTSNATTTTANSTNTVADESLVLRFAVVDDGYSVASGFQPTDHTSLWMANAPSASLYASTMAAWINQATAGATGTGVFTHANEQAGAITIAIAPASFVGPMPSRVTSAGVMVETRFPATIRLTSAGRIVEHHIPLKVTGAGVMVETELPWAEWIIPPCLDYFQIGETPETLKKLVVLFEEYQEGFIAQDNRSADVAGNLLAQEGALPYFWRGSCELALNEEHFGEEYWTLSDLRALVRSTNILYLLNQFNNDEMGTSVAGVPTRVVWMEGFNPIYYSPRHDIASVPFSLIEIL